MKIKTTQTLLATSLLLAMTAGSASSVFKTFPQNWYLQGNVGMTLQKATGTNFIATDTPTDTSSEPDAYQVSKLANAMSFGLEGGYQGQRANVNSSPWFATYQVGLRYQNTASASLKGNVIQYSGAQFDNYNYNYSVSSQRLLVMGRMDIYKWKRLSPFAEVGVGYENDNVSAYSETASSSAVTPRLPPEFSSATSGGVSYLVGLGLKANIKSNFWVSVSDDLNNAPSYKTGTGVAAGAEGVSLKNTVNSQTVLLSVGYLFK